MTQSTQMIEELDNCLMKTTANILKYFDKEEQKNMLDQLKDILKNNCIESTKLETAAEIKNRLTSMMEAEPEKKVKDIVKEYREAIAAIEVDPSKDKRLVEYDRQMGDLYESSQMCNKTLDDSDLRLTSQNVNVIDPISKTRMVDPVKNAVCGHTYDRGNLIAMLQRNNKTRCPVIGCTSKEYIDLNQCRVDIVTKMYLEKNPK